MFATRFRLSIIAGWFAIMIVYVSARLALGTPMSIREGLALVFVVGLPPLIVVSLFRSAPPVSVSQVLRDSEQTVR
ncbi:MAG: hypothetical protein ACREMA_18700 [Longimicrobiales bacterium]